MQKISQVMSKMLLGLFIMMVVSMTTMPPAEAFNLTITNNYPKVKSFCILYYEDKAQEWVCRGWFNVPANTEKVYKFTDSTSLSYAYLYSSVWDGAGEESAISRTIIDESFKYYDSQECPPGKNSHEVAFSKFGMCINGAHLIWGKATGKSGAVSTNANITQEESKAIALLNQDRQKNGLAPLIADSRLTQVARKHGKDMIDQNYFDHVNLQGQSPFDRLTANGISYRSAGENIATNTNVTAMEDAWMHSPKHRDNILNTKFTHVGIGLQRATDNTLYGVQLFASY